MTLDSAKCFRYNTKSKSNKIEINKLDFTEIKNICVSNNTIKSVKNNLQNGG